MPRLLRLLRRYLRNRQILVGSLLIVLLLSSAIFGPRLAPYGFDETDMLRTWERPSPGHPMGTDRLGRDLMSRLIFGGRISLTVGLASMVIALLIGVTVGAIAGYAGRWLDAVLMQVINVMLAFPALLLMILLAVTLGPGVRSMVLAIGLTTWAHLARIVRAEFLRVRALEYVMAARATGTGHLRIVVRHILPNTLAAVVVFVTFGIPFAVMSEAGLGFIGLGVTRPPRAGAYC